jgi:hypothetical protein
MAEPRWREDHEARARQYREEAALFAEVGELRAEIEKCDGMVGQTSGPLSSGYLNRWSDAKQAYEALSPQKVARYDELTAAARVELAKAETKPSRWRRTASGDLVDLQKAVDQLESGSRTLPPGRGTAGGSTFVGDLQKAAPRPAVEQLLDQALAPLRRQLEDITRETKQLREGK